MNKILTGIVSALLVAGIAGMYIPNASATIMQDEFCSGNSALGQEASSSAEQGPSQDQASGSDAQSVAPEFNALTGNNLNLNDQQNGDCLSPLGGPNGVPMVADENADPLASTTALQNSTD
ncbi:MAG: hypothetical protein L0H53_15555 [Candidatus Nitrosocosmicus sp.]|nr:hypothetical protein [Candidatus Nitrosocosmicus sp.]MDN5866950.1 hypothetical protein [Candidatus Nitrosocosmicus sp.]